jgi:Trk K+ transport system NAD-binding subunit
VNLLLAWWRRAVEADLPGAGPGAAPGRVRRRIVFSSTAQATAAIFLVLRRMRSPLIVLILIFAVTVLGLTLVPGVDAAGRPARLGFFDAFYFMSYTATTIGFGELPNAFTDAQRMWVTLSIYLTVIGWAYAIGTLLSLLQDRSFRSALALQRFNRNVKRLREPFLLIAGYGRTGELLGKAFDELGRRFVVVDVDEDRIESLDIDAYHADIPGLVADAADPAHLGVAGMSHAYCEGVLALTNDDDVNLAVAMSAALLRPELPVIARTVSPAIEDRMHAFGTPTVVNPFDRFGDHLRLAMRAPASYQLLTWLESGPGTELPDRGVPPAHGRWVVCGYGRFGRKLVSDLRADGVEVVAIDQQRHTVEDPDDGPAPPMVVGDASEPTVMQKAHVENAVGFVAGTDDDTTNLSLIAAARRRNPHLYVVARQNKAMNAPLFAAMEVDVLLVPSEVIAHEAYTQLSTPLLWRFVREMPRMGDDWARTMLSRLTTHCGHRLQGLWKIRLTAAEAPGIHHRLAAGEIVLGDLLRDPDDRSRQLDVVPLLLRRGEDAVLGPSADTMLQPDDEVLFAGQSGARRALETTLVVEAAGTYVVTGVTVPASWIWRQLSRRQRA